MNPNCETSAIESMKNCSKCGKKKTLESFPPNKNTLDKRQSSCRMCERLSKRKYKSFWRKKNPVKAKLASKTYKSANKEKINAHSQVSYALKKKKLLKFPCTICGNEQSQAHHEDYTKPLMVTWFCQSHHHQWHLILRGEFVTT